MVTKEQLHHIATLARLALSEKEIVAFQSQISDILDFVHVLETIDTTAVEPLHQVGEQTSVMRDDRVVLNEDRELLLSSAPDRAGDYIQTPAVFDT